MLSPNPAIDVAIINAYAEFDVPSDQILRDDGLAAHFERLVASHLDANVYLPSTVVLDRLIYLRKRGRLPRLRRRKRV